MAPSEIVIHARYAPDGTCQEIGSCPATLTPQAWFKYLYDHAGNSAMPLAGGRLIFRLPIAELEKHQAAAVSA